jgi:spermidine/putrescine-binding protein
MFKQFAAVTLLTLLALILSACGPVTNTAEPTAVSAVGPVTSDRCGDRSQLAPEITIFNWTEYLDPALREQFEQECGVKVTEVYFDSNETLLNAMIGGGANYDIIVPSDYMVQLMIAQDMLEPLDFGVIPNIANYGDAFMHRYFDPEQKYTVPYFWGTTAFVIDTEKVPDFTPSWKMLFEPTEETCGQISMLDDQRDVIGAALLYLGYSINDVDPAHLEEAKEVLIRQADCVKAYDSNTNDDLIIQGETALAHIWVGDAVLYTNNPDGGGRETIQYILPEEGNVIYQENLAVPRTAQNKYTAMVFINYLSDPQINAQNADYVGYATTNVAAREFIDPSFAANQSLYPPEEALDKMEWLQDVGDAIELYDRVWTEFKAAAGGG